MNKRVVTFITAITLIYIMYSLGKRMKLYNSTDNENILKACSRIIFEDNIISLPKEHWLHFNSYVGMYIFILLGF